MTDKLTFEQAHDELENLTEYGLNDNKIFVGKVSDIERIFDGLQANYAPRIEMTPDEFENLMDGNVGGNLETINEALDKPDASLIKFTVRQTLTAILNPESIINSETGKPFVEEEV